MYPNKVDNYSGIFVHEQVKALIKLGVKVEVIAPTPYSPKILSMFNKRWRAFSKISRVEIIDGVTIHRPKFIAIPGGKMKHYWGYFYAYLAKNTVRMILQKTDIDLFHVHGTIPDDHAVSILSKKFNIPFVATVHGASVFAVRKIKNHFQQSLNSKRKSSAIICVSKVLQKKMVEYIGSLYKGNFYTIYNGYKHDVNIDRTKKSNEFVILFVGTIYEQKGIRYLIEAFYRIHNKYKNTKLIIVGSGVLLDEMKILSQKLGVSNNIEFKGAFPHEKVLKEYSRSDVFVLPSWNEGFGVVYLEAMSQKVPIIGSKGYGISDIIVDGKNGLLVEPRNSTEIYEKLEILINNEEIKNHIGENGSKTIEGFTWEKNAIENVKVYESVLKRIIVDKQ